MLLCEKDMDTEVDIQEVDLNIKPEEIRLYNPLYGQVPILKDRELVLYESNIINEYLDVRFPHPQLMPIDIKKCASARLLLHKIDTEIFPYLRMLILKRRMLKKERAAEARQRIVSGLTELSDVLNKDFHFAMGRELTMLDLALAPLLWRLDNYKIVLPARIAKRIYTYAERVFSREKFVRSLSEIEKSMRR